MPEYLKVQRTFTVKLTELEIAALDSEARKKLIAGDKAEQERLAKASEASEARKRVKGLQSEALTAARAAALGKMERSIACEWRPHPTAERMQLVRLDFAPDDPKRIVDERPMTPAEKKGEMSGQVAPSSTEPAPDSAKANPEPKKAKKAGKDPEMCPGTIAQPDRDDPLKDTMCDQHCLPRKWACALHVELPNSDKVSLIARQQRRAFLREKAAGCQVQMYPGTNDVVCGEALPCAQHAEKVVEEQAGAGLQ